MLFDFQLGIPFRPYEQLMGVVPVVFAKLYLIVCWSPAIGLMYDPNLLILDFHPLESEPDLNGENKIGKRL